MNNHIKQLLFFVIPLAFAAQSSLAAQSNNKWRTYLVKDVNFGDTQSSYPQNLKVLGEMLYFVTAPSGEDYSDRGHKIWASNGTEIGK